MSASSSASPNATSSAAAPLAPAGYCAACGTPLAAGARFCHRCGTPFGEGGPPVRAAAATSGAASILPWGVAFVAILALVAMIAGQRFGAAGGSALNGSANALPTQALDGVAAGAAPGAAPGGAGPAPNIANMSPEEAAGRLFNRVMTYFGRGQLDSAAFFAPMALAAHEQLPAPTLDERYHHGRIAYAVGDTVVARAQADTILAAAPDYLLGLMLAADAARLAGDSARGRALDARLLSVVDAQRARQLPEYLQHDTEISLAVERAGGSSSAPPR